MFEEVIQKIDRDDIFIFKSEIGNVSDKGIVFLFSHELSRTGAPSVLLELGKTLCEDGYSIFVSSLKDGELREDFLCSGMNVIINEQPDEEWINTISDISKFCIVNTLLCLDIIELFNNKNIPVVWWIHEAEIFFQNYAQNVTIAPNITLCAAGTYVKSMIDKYLKKDSYILNFGITDGNVNPEYRRADILARVRFINVGAANGIKGQEVIGNAILLLAPHIRSRAEFYFCGDYSKSNMVTEYIHKLSVIYDNVKILPNMDRSDLFSLYRIMDCLICSSWVETTSAVMVEAMMMGITGICSDACGIASYIVDGKNGFVFPSGNAHALAEKITYVVEHINELECIRRAGRNVYEEVYSVPAFKNNLNMILKHIL